MTTREQIKGLITKDRFPAPTMPFHLAAASMHPVKIIHMTGAVDCIPEVQDNTRRFAVVEVRAPKVRAPASGPIQIDGPYHSRHRARRVRPVASVLLCALVVMALRGG